MQTEDSSIVAKLTAVKAAVGVVGKDQENQEGRKFKFRSIDAVVNAVAQALIDQGVIVHSTSAELIASEQVNYGAKGTLGFRTTLAVEYEWTDGTSAITSQVIAESIDSGDKGTAKAMSVAYRIAILQTLTLPTGERDPDHDVYEVNELNQELPVRSRLNLTLAESGLPKHVVYDLTVSTIGRSIRDTNDLSENECSNLLRVIEGAIADASMNQEEQ